MGKNNCKKCNRELPEGANYCPVCGAKATLTRKGRARPNGLGTAYRRGRTWTAVVVSGWHMCPPNDAYPGGHLAPVRITKGGFATKKEALAYCPQMLAAGKRPHRAGLTFDQIYTAWEEGYRDKIGKSTLNCYRAARKYFSDLWPLPFYSIGLDELQDCVDECPNGRRTKENMKALASLMYKYALPRHQSDMDYAQYIDPGVNDKTKRPPFTMEQVEIIRKFVGVIPYADVIYDLIYTGCRPIELLSMTRANYFEDAEGAYLIGGVKTEAGKNRAIPLSEKIVQDIRARVANASAPDYWLFPRDDGAEMKVSYFRDRYFYPALAQMGIQAVPDEGHPAILMPYSCRHTFSNLLKNVRGADVDKAALIGHASYETTKVAYQSDDLASKRAIINQL